MRDEAPPHEGELAHVVLDADHRDDLGRGDVVPEGQEKVAGAIDTKAGGDVVNVVDVVETAAHM